MKFVTVSPFAACCLVFLFAANTQAAVSITTQLQPTPGLSGFTTAILTAVSDNSAQPILAFDFSGHPDDNNSATGKGFFGSMNHVTPAGMAMIFSTNWDPLIGFLVDAPILRGQDSHFLINQTAVIPGLPHQQEGPEILQAIWAYPEPQGLSVPFAHLVVPNAAASSVSYRGIVLVGEAGSSIELNVSGLINVPEPTAGLMYLMVGCVGWTFVRFRCG
jgi:hypothetical protein